MDRRLAEMTGMWDDIDGHTVCPNFSTPEWRSRLMDWATEQEWWKLFIWKVKMAFLKKWDSCDGVDISSTRDAEFVKYLWRNLSELLVEYRGEGGK